MLNGYVMLGVTGEILMVIRSFDEEAIISIIKKLQASRDKDLKDLGVRLEMELNEGHNRDPSKPEPQDKRPGSRSVKGRNRKTAHPEPEPERSPKGRPRVRKTGTGMGK
jgi:hypothetical protein